MEVIDITPKVLTQILEFLVFVQHLQCYHKINKLFYYKFIILDGYTILVWLFHFMWSFNLHLSLEKQ